MSAFPRLRWRAGGALARIALAALAVASAFVPNAARADEPVALEVPTDAVHVGDVVTLRAHPPVKAGEQVLAPDLGGSLGKLAVRAVRVEPPAPGAADARPTLVIDVQPFEIGSVDVPPVPFQVRGADGAVAEWTTTSAKLEVATVLRAGEQEPKPADLAPPAELAFDRKRLAKIAAVVLGLLALGAWLGWWLKRRFGGPRAKPLPPPIPADIRALADLEALLGAPHLAQGELRRFHIELAAILKRYLEDRFTFPAVERTTIEVERDLRRLAVDAQAQLPAIQVLRDCDRVKFANASTTAEEGRKRASDVRAVVERTRVGLATGPAEESRS